MPVRKTCGGVIVTVVLSTTTATGAAGWPSGPISRIASGEIGSLKVKTSAAGGSGITAPSAGTAFTSEACAQAVDAGAIPLSSAIQNATRRAAPRAVICADYFFGKSFSAGAGSG